MHSLVLLVGIIVATSLAHEAPQYVGSAMLNLTVEDVRVVKLNIGNTFGTAITVVFDESVVSVCGNLGPMGMGRCNVVHAYRRVVPQGADGEWWFMVRLNDTVTSLTTTTKTAVRLDFSVDHLQVLESGVISRYFDILPNGFELFAAPASSVLLFEYIVGGVGHVTSYLNAPQLTFGCQEDATSSQCYVRNVVPVPSDPWLVVTTAWSPPPSSGDSSNTTSNNCNCSVVAIDRQVRATVVPMLNISYGEPIPLRWILSNSTSASPWDQGSRTVKLIVGANHSPVGFWCSVVVPQQNLTVTCGGDSLNLAGVNVAAAQGDGAKFQGDFSSNGLYLGSLNASSSAWYLLISVSNRTLLGSSAGDAYVQIRTFSPDQIEAIQFNSSQVMSPQDPLLIYHLETPPGSVYGGLWMSISSIPTGWLACNDPSCLLSHYLESDIFYRMSCDGSPLFLMSSIPTIVNTTFTIALPETVFMNSFNLTRVPVAAFQVKQIVVTNPGPVTIMTFPATSATPASSCSVFSDYDYNSFFLFTQAWAPIPAGMSYLLADFTSETKAGHVDVQILTRVERNWKDGATVEFSLEKNSMEAIAITGIPFGAATYIWIELKFPPTGWKIYLLNLQGRQLALSPAEPAVLWTNNTNDFSELSADMTSATILLCAEPQSGGGEPAKFSVTMHSPIQVMSGVPIEAAWAPLQVFSLQGLRARESVQLDYVIENLESSSIVNVWSGDSFDNQFQYPSFGPNHTGLLQSSWTGNATWFLFVWRQADDDAVQAPINVTMRQHFAYIVCSAEMSCNGRGFCNPNDTETEQCECVGFHGASCAIRNAANNMFWIAVLVAVAAYAILYVAYVRLRSWVRAREGNTIPQSLEMSHALVEAAVIPSAGALISFDTLHVTGRLNGISGDFCPGQLSIIMGGSGAGKSSLLAALIGFLPLSSGTIYWNGAAANLEDRSYRASVGFVPQHDVLLETLTVKENISFAANLRVKHGGKIRKERIKNALKRLQLWEVRHSIVSQVFFCFFILFFLFFFPPPPPKHSSSSSKVFWWPTQKMLCCNGTCL